MEREKEWKKPARSNLGVRVANFTTYIYFAIEALKHAPPESAENIRWKDSAVIHWSEGSWMSVVAWLYEIPIQYVLKTLPKNHAGIQHLSGEEKSEWYWSGG